MSWANVEECAWEMNKKGVAKQCSIQSVAVNAPK